MEDSYNSTPLIWASNNGKTEMLKLLIEHKANLNFTNRGGNGPLLCAVYSRNIETVRALVEALCDITIRNNGMTAAEDAKQKGYHAIARYLTNEAPRVQVH